MLTIFLYAEYGREQFALSGFLNSEGDGLLCLHTRKLAAQNRRAESRLGGGISAGHANAVQAVDSKLFDNLNT